MLRLICRLGERLPLRRTLLGYGLVLYAELYLLVGRQTLELPLVRIFFDSLFHVVHLSVLSLEVRGLRHHVLSVRIVLAGLGKLINFNGSISFVLPVPLDLLALKSSRYVAVHRLNLVLTRSKRELDEVV